MNLNIEYLLIAVWNMKRRKLKIQHGLRGNVACTTRNITAK